MSAGIREIRGLNSRPDSRPDSRVRTSSDLFQAGSPTSPGRVCAKSQRHLPAIICRRTSSRPNRRFWMAGNPRARACGWLL